MTKDQLEEGLSTLEIIKNLEFELRAKSIYMDTISSHVARRESTVCVCFDSEYMGKGIGVKVNVPTEYLYSIIKKEVTDIENEIAQLKAAFARL